ncbi:hypothetical protein [Psychroflexus sediminis]|uniref:Uncharacterized protein n=1 Tax=Psychroflexus sediminis TaxID=470826 RepID=A0A1G7VZA2_9FLAO|nr:hypothetical protein [Psychroflexus sediminis]SDG65095.1 hypothetical protein SAMN04488027_104276 [Psychroflexus sediminis]
MNRFLFFLMLFLSVNCFSQNNDIISLLTKNDFSKSEAKELQKLINYFESEGGIKESDLKNSYVNFIYVTSLYPDSLATQIFEKTKFRKRFNDIPNSLKSDLWQLYEGTAYMSHDRVEFKEPIKYQSYGIRINGRFINLLKTISDKRVQKYVERITETGDLPTSFIYRNIILDYREINNIDFESDYWRLINTIQFLTQLNEYYDYSDLSN